MTYISVHADKSALASTLCATIVAQSVEAIQDHGVYLLAVSGGSIPKMLSHSNLSAAFTSAGVEMNLSKWTVFLADERIVAVDSLDSNLLALRKDGFIGGVDGQEERCRCFGIEGFGEVGEGGGGGGGAGGAKGMRSRRSEATTAYLDPPWDLLCSSYN